jgi:hypothetical protein
VHVQDGVAQDPYLLWTIVVVGSFDGVLDHELDNGSTVHISASCSDTVVTNCIVSAVKVGNVTTIVFRTLTNGRIRV